jgi:hypothetical protein
MPSSTPHREHRGLEKPSEDALAAITTLDTQAQALKKRGDEMRDRGAAYFELWRRQLARRRRRKSRRSPRSARKSSREVRGGPDGDAGDRVGEHRVLDRHECDPQGHRSGLTADANKLLAPQVKTARRRRRR